MKILHLADIHKNTKRYADVEISLDVVEDTARREKVDAILIAGDIYDGTEQNSEIGLHTPFARRMQHLGNIAPVAIVKGTPTHDIPGSLDIFEELACEFGITILQPGETYILTADHGILNATGKDGGRWDEHDLAVLFGLPEPGRSWVAARTIDGKSKSGDEINAELRALVSCLLLGYGAKRHQYPELPCVFVTHGQVVGCKLANGMTLPNGHVSADDLRMVGADYYALGDIHEPQQIPGLPAYYPGSVYTDWGEYHKAGCNLVEIGQVGDDLGGLYMPPSFLAHVSRIEFPHPQRKKIELTSGLPLAKDYEGRLVWVNLTVSQAEAADLDSEVLLADILQGGALLGSRVTINKISVETVRAGEIAKKAALTEKVEVWGEASDVEITESVIAKAAVAEASVGSLAALAGPEKRFRNVWTRLRGSKGFWKKQKKDEVFIPWAELGEGVIAYVGPNGNGKTTSYDFAKPWAVPVSRPPKTLKAHFRLRDSSIENVYLEECTGIYYRILINIDGANKSGDAKYFFYRGPSADGPWTPYTEEACSGRQDGFFVAIDEVFGSMAIYMRTAFAAQTPTPDFPDIARAPQGEKKQLIAELAGKDYAPYRDYSTNKVKVGETALVALDATISAAADVDETIVRLEAEKTEAGEAHQKAQRDIDGLVETEKFRVAEREVLALRVAEVSRKAERRSQISREVGEIDRNLMAIRTEIDEFTKAAERRGAAEKELAKIVALENKRSELVADLARINEANRLVSATYQTMTAELRRKQDIARAQLDRARAKLTEAEKAHEVARARVDFGAAGKLDAARSELKKCEEATADAGRVASAASASLERLRKEHAETKALSSLVAELHDGQPCPLCGGADHPSPAHADAERLRQLEGDGKLAALRSTQASYDILEAGRAEERARSALRTIETAVQSAEEAKENLVGLSAASQDARDAVEAAEAILNAIIIPFPPDPAPFLGAPELSDVELGLKCANKAASEETIRKAAEAEVRTEEAKKRQVNAEDRRGSLMREYYSLATTPEEDNLSWDLAAKDKEIEATRSKLSAAREVGAAARATIQAKDQALADARKRKDVRTEAQKERTITATELAEWRLLERAIDGVRDLELDALAPSIADIATRLLQSSGREGHVEIDTTRISSGSIKKARQIEDFLIFYVGLDGERQDIATCSGGEMVWIRKALYDAFAIIRARNGNIKFMTAFLDETDGALYPKDRQDYFRMLLEAHKESGRYQTFLTTHSPDIIAMAAVTLDVTVLGPRD